jgi:hypothetical protein
VPIIRVMAEMYADKKYRRHDSNALMSYIDRTERPIRDCSGREMSSEDIQQFIDTSKEYGYEESWIYSPKRGDELSEAEISLAVRKTMRKHLEDRQRATYCFGVHTDDENNHAHIAVTGASSDLHTDIDDLDRMRSLGAKHTREQERDRARERRKEREREREQQRERDRNWGRSR